MHRKTHILKIILAVSLALAIPSNASAATETITACGSSANPLTIPAAQTINITIEGAGGGGGDSAAGGGGGLIELEYQASKGETLELYAGCGGVNSNGAGGAGYVAGAAGENTDGTTGGGGGSSAVLGGNNNKIASAGGGGGAGYEGGFLGIGAGAGGAGGGEGGGAGGTTDAPAGSVGSPVINQGTALTQTDGGGGAGGASGADGSDGQVVVEYNIPPTVRSNKTFNGTDQNNLVEKDKYVSSDTLTVRSNITDPDSNLGEARLSIRDPTGNLVLNNGSMSQIDTVTIDGDSGGTFERDFNFPYIFLGEWSYNVWGSDEQGFWNKSSGSFEMIDLTPPETRNTFQNRTLMTVHDTALLQAEGYDNWNLSHAMLATNETGEWENKTENYGSPQTPYTFQTWTTTGFAWKNNSMTGNKSVHWRIWYNDTSGQHSVTETNSFRVRENFNWKGSREPLIGYTRKSPRNVANGRSLRQAVKVKSIRTRINDLKRVRNTLIHVQEPTVRSQIIKPLMEDSLTTMSGSARASSGFRNLLTGAAFKAPVERINDVSRIFANSIKVENQLQRAFTGARVQIDQISIDENTFRSQNLNRIAEVSLLFSTSVDRQGAVNRIIYDQISSISQLSREFTGLRQFRTDLDLENRQERKIFSNRVFRDNIATAVAVEPFFSGFRSFETGISAEETTLSTSFLARNFQQTVSQQDVISRSFRGGRIQEQSIELTDLQTRTQAVNRIQIASFGLTEQVVRETLVNRLIEDEIEMDETYSRGFIGARVFSQSLNTQISPDRLVFGNRLVADTFNIGTTTNSYFSGFRTVQEQLTATDNILRSLLNLRQLSESISYSQNLEPASDLDRLFNQQLSSAQTETRTASNLRYIAESIGSNTATSRQSSISRTLLEVTGIHSNIVSGTDLDRQFRQTLQPELIGGQGFTGSRQISLTYGIQEEKVEDVFIIRLNQLTAAFSTTETQNSALHRQEVSDIVSEIIADRSVSNSRIFEQTVKSITNNYRNLNNQRLISNNIQTIENSYRTLEVSRSLFTNIAADSVTPRISKNLRTFEEILDYSETLRIYFIGDRSTETNIKTTNQPNSIFRQSRTFNSIFTGQTFAPRSLNNNRELLNTFTFQTPALRLSSSARKVIETAVTGFEAEEQIFSYRSIQETVDLTETTSAQNVLERVRQLTIGYNSQQASSSVLVRNRITALGVTGTVKRNLAMDRSFAEVFGADTAASGSRTQLRQLIMEVGFTGDPSRSLLTGRLISEQFETALDSSVSSVLSRNQQTQIRGIFDVTGGTLTERLFQQEVSAGASTDRIISTGRLIESIFSTSSELETSSIQERVLESGIDTTSTFNRDLNIGRLFYTDISGDTGSQGGPTSARMITEAINTAIDPERTNIGFSRSILNAVEASIDNDRLISSFRIEETATLAGINLNRQILSERANILDIGLTGRFTQSSSLFRSLSQNYLAGNNFLRSINTYRTEQTEVGTETRSFKVSDLSRSLTEALTASAASNRELINSRTVESYLETTDSIYLSIILNREKDLALQVAPKNTVLANLERAFKQNFLTSTNQEIVSSTPRFINTAITGEFSSERSFLGLRQNFFNLEVGQSSLSSTFLQRTVSETFSPQEESSISRNLIREIGIVINPASNIDKLNIFKRQIIENGFISGKEFVGGGTTVRIITLNIETMLSDTQKSILQRTLIQSIQQDSQFKGFPSVGRFITTGFQFGETTDRQITGSRSITSILEISTERSTTSGLLRNFNTALQIGVRNPAQTVFRRNLESELTADTTAGRFFITGRTINTDTEILETLTNNIELSRQLRQQINSESLENRFYSLDRSIQQETVFTLNQGRRSIILKTIGQEITGEFNQITESVVTRALGTGIGTKADSTSISLLQRALTTGLDLENVQGSSSSVSRISAEILTIMGVQESGQESDRLIQELIGSEIVQSSNSNPWREVFTIFQSDEESSSTPIFTRLSPTGLAYSSTSRTQRILQATVSNILNFETSEDRELDFMRSIGNEIVLQESAFPDFNVFTAIIETSIGVQDTETRYTSIFRQVSETFNLDWFFDGVIPDTSDPESPRDSDDSDDGDGGGTGGGGSGGGFTPIGDDIGQPELSFVGNGINVKLSSGESSMAQIELENTGDAKAEALIEVKRLNAGTVKSIQVSENEYTIVAGESVSPRLDIKAPEYLGQNNTGKILERELEASAQNTNTSIPVNILLESEKEELLDVKVEMDRKTFSNPRTADYSFEIFNLGQAQEVDIQLYTTIKNETGAVIHETKEELAVQTSASISRDLDIDLPPGEYRFETKAEYSGKDASSFTTFTVEEEETQILSSKEILLVLLPLLIILILVITRLYRRSLPIASKDVEQNVQDLIEHKEQKEIDLEDMILSAQESEGNIIERERSGRQKIENKFKEISSKLDRLEDITDDEE